MLNHLPKIGQTYAIIMAVALTLFVSALALSAQSEPQLFVNHIFIDGTINPAVADFVGESIQTSHQGGARALVIQLDTPGGLLSSTRQIVKDILGAPIPVIVYVAPSGSSSSLSRDVHHHVCPCSGDGSGNQHRGRAPSGCGRGRS